MRVSQTDEATGITTAYLIDLLNPTGYAKQLEEYEIDSGTWTLMRSYMIGLMILSQTNHTASLAGSAETTLSFVQDAAGHTRGLLNNIGQVARTADVDQVAQIFTQEAFGDLVGIDQSKVLTSWLRVDGMYDSVTGFTYHLERWRSGFRFTSMDSFAGDPLSPLSLHKRIYGHMNPVMEVDPSGLMALTIQQKAVIGVTLFLTAVLVNQALNPALRNVNTRIDVIEAIQSFVGSGVEAAQDAALLLASQTDKVTQA